MYWWVSSVLGILRVVTRLDVACVTEQTHDICVYGLYDRVSFAVP